jgi:lipopolysaccharide transport protein LptA
MFRSIIMKFHIVGLFMLSFHLLFAEALNITSTRMHAKEAQKEAHFIGNVVLKQLTDWLTSDKLIVHFDDNKTVQMYEAIGKVEFEVTKKGSLYEGRAHRVIYTPITKTYTLLGNAYVKDKTLGRETTGDTIVMDLTQERFDVDSNQTKPVEMTFEVGE